MRNRRLFYQKRWSIQSFGEQPGFGRDGWLRRPGQFGGTAQFAGHGQRQGRRSRRGRGAIEYSGVPDFQADEIHSLMGVYRILPTLRRPEITGEAGDKRIAFNSDVEIVALVVAKKKGGRSTARIVERDIFHPEPQVMAGTVDFDVVNDAGRVSPVSN